MKLAVGLTLAAFATFASCAAAAPGRMDTSKRAARFSTGDKAPLQDSAFPVERNEVLMDRRFDSGDGFEKKDALVGERRAGVEVGETREKTLFRTPERKEYERIERKDNAWSGKRSRFSTADDAYRSKVAERFQEKIGDASPLGGDVKPVISQRTTFDRINRFAFRKNGDQAVSVTVAGSEEAARDISGASSPGAVAPAPSGAVSPPEGPRPLAR